MKFSPQFFVGEISLDDEFFFSKWWKYSVFKFFSIAELQKNKNQLKKFLDSILSSNRQLEI
jgi:hypothetical protein